MQHARKRNWKDQQQAEAIGVFVTAVARRQSRTVATLVKSRMATTLLFIRVLLVSLLKPLNEGERL